MIFKINYRNFLAMMTIVTSSSTSEAFNNPSKAGMSSPTPPTTFDDGQLNAAMVEGPTTGGSNSIVGDEQQYDIFSNEDEEDAAEAAPMMNWSSLTEMIKSKIDDAENAITDGSSLSEEAKDEIIATAVAGSVLGTAVGSPMIIGAALGYAGSQMLHGNENAEKARHALGQASHAAIEQANSAIVFTKNELKNEKDLSQASKKILLAIQEKAGAVQTELKQKSPQRLAEEMKENVLKTVESEEFKSLPKRSFLAIREFLESDEVKNVSSKAMKAIKDGLDSEEMKALQQRASQSLKETIDTTATATTKTIPSSKQ